MLFLVFVQDAADVAFTVSGAVLGALIAVSDFGGTIEQNKEVLYLGLLILLLVYANRVVLANMTKFKADLLIKVKGTGVKQDVIDAVYLEEKRGSVSVKRNVESDTVVLSTGNFMALWPVFFSLAFAAATLVLALIIDDIIDDTARKHFLTEDDSCLCISNLGSANPKAADANVLRLTRQYRICLSTFVLVVASGILLVVTFISALLLGTIRIPNWPSRLAHYTVALLNYHGYAARYGTYSPSYGDAYEDTARLCHARWQATHVVTRLRSVDGTPKPTRVDAVRISWRVVKEVPRKQHVSSGVHEHAMNVHQHVSVEVCNNVSNAYEDEVKDEKASTVADVDNVERGERRGKRIKAVVEEVEVEISERDRSVERQLSGELVAVPQVGDLMNWAKKLHALHDEVNT